MALNKNDSEARALWGAAYEAMPKSVFAVMAYHLADLASEDGDSAIGRALEEVNALAMNGLITETQHKNAARALQGVSA
ncbi:hypothetical protein [Qipengyuania atrilutea]|uniref:Uncharacterized protein n=1 Tax=Qipengyuania atrilutea TaxID=2744473 RepID=A0A850H3A9_9SPHN|nr:hypothetical protein [Actirhodobacter atriluteus]NVD44363.1 hypothetical protein [Actirhodobacter atriluteus]